MGFLFRLLSRLPLPLLHNLGALAGWLAYGLSPTYRRHLRENMAQAGVENMRAVAIAEAGKTILELPKIWLRSQEEVVGRIARITGREHVDAARAVGRGVLFLTPHLGCFEIIGRYLVSFRPFTALYRRPRQAWLGRLIEEGRGDCFKLAPADLSGVRRMMKALKQNESVGILPDQAPGAGEGLWAPFFRRPAYTMTLAARLAGTGATVLLTYAERLPYGAGYHLHFQPLTAPLEGDLPTRVARLNGELERLILECPEQYLWGYNRYKKPSGASNPT
ncbi:MAG: lysophospholipid acyltransferase family protein [Rhodocyclaceae bacterium]|nr:lysophospholipid acyltransferase family protein [Rhodocyclaceae bacterium]